MKKLIVFIVLPIAIILSAYIIFKLSQTPYKGYGSPPPHPVVLGKVESKDINFSQEFIGAIEADQKVELKARVEGYLIKKNFQAGDFIKKGSLIFQIEPDQYQALLEVAKSEVVSAEATLKQASLDFQRFSDLYLEKAIAKSDYDVKKANFDVAKASFSAAKARQHQAELNLAYTSITAPFDGYVSDTPYSVGSLLTPESQTLAIIISSNPILATFSISDKNLQIIKNRYNLNIYDKNAWKIKLKIFENKFYSETGLLDYIAPLVDRSTDTIKFKAKFTNADNTLNPGQVVKVLLESTKSESALVIPKNAVITASDSQYVLVPSIGKDNQTYAKKQTITIKEELTNDYIIASGLKLGDEFIVSGLMANGATLNEHIPLKVLTANEANALQNPNMSQ